MGIVFISKLKSNQLNLFNTWKIMKINLRKVRKKLEIMNAFWNFPTDSLSIGRYPSPVLYPSGRGQLQGSGLVQGWNSDRLQFLAATRSQIVVFLPRAWCHRLKLFVCTNFPPVFRPFPGPHNWDWTRVCPYLEGLFRAMNVASRYSLRSFLRVLFCSWSVFCAFWEGAWQG